MWSSLRREYNNCKAKNNKSGQHGTFKQYCGGNGDVLYLHHWLLLKPNMLSNVEGGFSEHDKFDSIPAAHMDEYFISSCTTESVEKCTNGSEEMFSHRGKVATPTSPLDKYQSPGYKDNQKIDQGMLEVASSLRYYADSQEKNSGVISLQKTRLENEIDIQKYQNLEDITQKIICAKNQLEKLKSNPKSTKVKRMLNDNIKIYTDKRQKIYDDLNSS